jgi:hypothetical protein
MVFGERGAKHVAIGFLLSGHSCCHAARARSLARAFSFSPPTTPLELNSHVVAATFHFIVLESSHFRLSLVTLGACSAKEFSRPPAQLAGSLLFPGRARKRLRALPTLYLRRLELFIIGLYCRSPTSHDATTKMKWTWMGKPSLFYHSTDCPSLATGRKFWSEHAKRCPFRT